MDEKAMVNDVLSNVKAELSTYQLAIAETENEELRQTLQQIRNDNEAYQYELFKVAKDKGYYKPAASVSSSEIETVKNQLGG